MTDEDKMYEEQMEMEISEYKQMLRKISQTCQVMLFHQGMGETCVFVMLMHAYKQKIKKPLVILAIQESRLQILQACPDIDEVILCGQEIYEKIKRDWELRETCHIMDFWELHFWSKGRGYRNFKEEICAYLGLPFDTEYVKYIISDGNTLLTVKEYFDYFGLKEGRTVFIVPSTICYGDQVVSKEYWKKLTVKIKESGRDVFFNAAEPFIEGERHGFWVCSQLPDFVRFCGNVVGARTGLLDFLATFTDVRIQAIYPNEYCNCWTDDAFRDSRMSHKELAESHLQSMNMARMLGAEHTIEFMHQNEDEEIERIVENLQ